MAHSELVKALPENVRHIPFSLLTWPIDLSLFSTVCLSVFCLQGNKETGLERVIDNVASFKWVYFLWHHHINSHHTTETTLICRRVWPRFNRGWHVLNCVVTPAKNSISWSFKDALWGRAYAILIAHRRLVFLGDKNNSQLSWRRLFLVSHVFNLLGIRQDVYKQYVGAHACHLAHSYTNRKVTAI